MDICERLRDEIKAEIDATCTGRTSTPRLDLLRDALDEIERLREDDELNSEVVVGLIRALKKKHKLVG